MVSLDDILITGRNEQREFVLGKVLIKLEEAGLRLNKDKCRFMQSEVVYLGHVIDMGLHQGKGRIQAITEAPTQYGKFSTVLAPLHKLL